MRYDFASDNTHGAAPEALEAMVRHGAGAVAAYGYDPVSARAADLIRQALDADAEVRFLASGTAANAVALSMLARPFEAVLAHEHAHIVTNEAGAPALFGHGSGLIQLKGAAGRIEEAALAAALAVQEVSHRQAPAALSLTEATEYGGVYGAERLSRLMTAARGHGLKVHLDGARLANAVAAGLDLKAVGRLAPDILVMGGSKAGMPPSEALVILNRDLAHRIDARLKQAGQVVSKARYLAAPWIGMLESGAWLRGAAHANAMARRLAALMPFPINHPVETNAVFAAIDDGTLARLHEAGWSIHRFLDGSARFMCSWQTTPDAVDELGAALKQLA